MNTARFAIALAVLLLAGCNTADTTQTTTRVPDSDVTPGDRLSLTSGVAADPISIDEGDAVEQAIDLGVDPEEALVILQFRAQIEAALGDLEEAFGDRLLFGSYADGKPEYVIYVTEIAASDSDWLNTVSTGGLGGTIAIEAAPGLASPGGPCLDRSMTVRGDTELHVAAGGQEIAASLGSIRIGYCTGDQRYGQQGLEGDGFYLTLDESTVTVGPSAVVEVSAPGMPGATLTADLPIGDESPGDPGGRIWELIAPTEPGTYEVLLEPAWAEGSGRFKFNLIVVDR